MQNILEQVRADLKANTDARTLATFQRFFKEEVKCYGVKTGTVEKIAHRYWKEVKSQPKETVFKLCEDLFQSGYTEEAFIVSYWAPNLEPQFEKKDLAVFKRWIELYIDNWAKCDGFCNHTVGDFIEMYPEMIPELGKWARSTNRWLKRASVVSLIVPAKRGRFLNEVFMISDILLTDPDDMVQKGYGWLLKEASRLHQKEVFEHVIRNQKVMPRTALRYAIELMPTEMKKEAMKRDK